MEETETRIRSIIDERMRPRARVDGGDIRFEKLVGSTLSIGAYADCATCPCCEKEFASWIADSVKKETGEDVRVIINKYVPYYAR